jgi:hypothetical protein
MSKSKRINLSAKARAAGLPVNVVLQRVQRLGWSEHKALTTPVGKYNKSNRVVPSVEHSRATTDRSSSEFFDEYTRRQLVKFAAVTAIVAIILWAINA